MRLVYRAFRRQPIDHRQSGQSPTNFAAPSYLPARRRQLAAWAEKDLGFAEEARLESVRRMAEAAHPMVSMLV
jgi:hypothetical protein